MHKQNATQLRKALVEICALDSKKVECQWQIANLLTAIRDHKLYQLDGYKTFADMVTNELELAPSTAGKYCKFYTLMTTLGYGRDETLKLMQKFGRNRLMSVLDNTNKKLGQRAIAAKLKQRDDAGPLMFHFNLDDNDTAATITKTLRQHGMSETQTGMRTGLTSAFVSLIADYERVNAELRKLRKGKNTRRLESAA